MATDNDKRVALLATVTTLFLLVVVIVMFKSGQRPILLTIIDIGLAMYSLKSLWKLKTPGR